MAASTGDKFTDTRNAARPTGTTVSSGRNAGGTSLACANLSGWPTASKVHFVTYQVDSNSNQVSGTQIDCYGIVSGNTLTSLTVIDGTDVGNSIGDVVEMIPTAAWAQDLADGLAVSHNRDGSLKNGIVTPSNLTSSVIGFVYPIGSIYTATVSTNPGTLLGFGTWTAFGAGRVLVGNGTSDQAFTAGATGGESNHTLTLSESPSHNHNTFATHGVGTSGAGIGLVDGPNSTSSSPSPAKTSTSGGDGSHNNLQPYIVVYMWQRVA